MPEDKDAHVFEKRAIDYELGKDYLNAAVEYRIASTEYEDIGDMKKAKEMLKKSDEMYEKNKSPESDA